MAGYLSYAFDPRFTLNTRLEWYNDSANGFSNGAPVSANYYEITAGVAIKPFPKDKFLSKLLIRPEIRYDHSTKPVFDGGNKDLVTGSVGVLFTFKRAGSKDCFEHDRDPWLTAHRVMRE